MFHLDISELIKTVGYVGLFAIIFAESGLFIGFFLPGDSLLFTAGFLASQGHMNIAIVMLLCFAASVLGDSFGYYFGKRVGHRIFNKQDSLLFSKSHVEKAEAFYEKYGKKTLIIARFVPVIRTFAPILAGVGKMNYGTFISYNVIGGVVWGLGLPAMGYYMGNNIPNIEKYLLPVILLIVFFSALPTLIHIFKSQEHRTQIWGFVKKIFNFN
jgi:membrane-associated protein